jgi:nitrile hydratase subunit beta
MGGMDGFGPVLAERDEPVFHAEWERRMFAVALASMGTRSFNIDEYRRTIERMPPAEYLAASYYERWLYALENLLIEKGAIARHEVDIVMAALQAVPSSPPATAHASSSSRKEPNAPGEKEAAKGATPETNSSSEGSVVEGGEGDSKGDEVRSATGSDRLSEVLGGGARSLRFDKKFHPRFKAGDRVIARNMNPTGHTRIPRYVRGRHGVIYRDWGVFVFPDTHSRGEGTKPQHCYAVEFDGNELWGSEHPAGELVYVDLWEDYLEADGAAATSPQIAKTGRPAIKASAKRRVAKPSRKSA